MKKTSGTTQTASTQIVPIKASDDACTWTIVNLRMSLRYGARCPELEHPAFERREDVLILNAIFGDVPNDAMLMQLAANPCRRAAQLA
jgi:hypothetical protein